MVWPACHIFHVRSSWVKLKRKREYNPTWSKILMGRVDIDFLPKKYFK